MTKEEEREVGKIVRKRKEKKNQVEDGLRRGKREQIWGWVFEASVCRSLSHPKLPHLTLLKFS